MIKKPAGNGEPMMADAMSYNKPLKRLTGWVVVSEHPIQIGCYPKNRNDGIETTPCFNRVSTGFKKSINELFVIIIFMK